jgi:hypothetical protein
VIEGPERQRFPAPVTYERLVCGLDGFGGGLDEGRPVRGGQRAAGTVNRPEAARKPTNADLLALREDPLWPMTWRRRLDGGSHDNKKRDMLEWAEYNLDLLTTHELFATATTGRLLRDHLGLPITCFRSGPFGGDQQIGRPRRRRRDRSARLLLGPA